ncbi:EAL domain-containing protein [Zoogloea sp.]|uniref:EAL domain-containing protein n=1 Tax=Zoogloea sp. TaxID=49181 RepID=UPI0014166B94|nr:MAG: EAL domain-containing protein [Zoogloea sp.]
MKRYFELFLAAGQTTAARSVRDGMLWLLPYLMIWTTVLIADESLRRLAPDSAAVGLSGAIATALRNLLPLAIWGSIGAVRAIQWHLPRAAVAFACVAYGLLVQQLLARHGEWTRQFLIVFSVVGPVLMVPVIGRLLQLRWTHLTFQATQAGENVSEVLNLVIPTLLAAVVLVAGMEAVGRGLEVLPLLAGGLGWVEDMPPLMIGAIYCVLNTALWGVGVHGYYALLPLLEALPVAPSAADPVTRSLLGAFVFLGGSGATASLIGALLLTSRSRKKRLIAVASILPALFNINELLLFGLPLILNVRLFPPLLLVPLANLMVAYGAVHLGWVPPLSVDLPFNTPIGLNAFIGAEGSYAAVLLQLCNLALGVAIYAPFVMAWERRAGGAGTPPLRSLDTSLSRREEEAGFLLDDPVGVSQRKWLEKRTLDARLMKYADLEFMLYYQPKVDPLSRRVTGCEALLRLVDGAGNIQLPGDFLNDLDRAGLSREVDEWVMQAAVEQISEWLETGAEVPGVAVNIGAASLMDQTAVQRLAELAGPYPGRLLVEITEHALVADEAQAQWAIGRLREAGLKIHIDDFGTGYSSLSYLHRFDVDGIKIDRSFTLSLHSQRGRDVFSAMCRLADQLRLALVVEGLEEHWQLQLLPVQSDLTVQGWYYSKALPPAAFLDYAAGPARVAASVG